MATTKLTGRWGEAEAGKYLRKNGYELVSCNYRCRFGEIDIIAQKGKYIVFAEVKLRKNSNFALALEHVDKRKQEKIKTTAQIWLAENETELQPRFDVIEIYAPDGLSDLKMEINHIENAF